MSHINTGLVAIVIAVALLSLTDATVKFLGSAIGVWQLYLVRSSVALLALGLFALCLGFPTTVKLRRPWWVFLRSALLAAMWVFYYVSLPYLPFSIAAAALYSSPLMMAALSRLLLKERLPEHCYAGVVVGFVGVILTLDLRSGLFNPALALPLLAALCYALAAIVTRSRCSSESALGLGMSLNLALAALGGTCLVILHTIGLNDWASSMPSFLSGWHPLSFLEIATLVGLGIAMAVIAVLVAHAYSSAPAPIVGVYDNLYLGFAIVWGVVFFDERPDDIQFLGFALLFIGAALSSWRRRVKRGPMSIKDR